MSELPCKPKFPAEVTPESWADYKAELRKYDADRIAAGIVTPAQIQSENSFFPPAARMRITGERTIPAGVQRLLDAAKSGS